MNSYLSVPDVWHLLYVFFFPIFSLQRLLLEGLLVAPRLQLRLSGRSSLRQPVISPLCVSRTFHFVCRRRFLNFQKPNFFDGIQLRAKQQPVTFSFFLTLIARSYEPGGRSSLATMKEDVLEFGDGAAFTGKFNLGKVSMLMQV